MNLCLHLKLSKLTLPLHSPPVVSSWQNESWGRYYLWLLRYRSTWFTPDFHKPYQKNWALRTSFSYTCSLRAQRHLGKQLFGGISKKLSGRIRLSYIFIVLRHFLSTPYSNVRLLRALISKVPLICCVEFLEDTFFSLCTVTKYLTTSIKSVWMSMTGAPKYIWY